MPRILVVDDSATMRRILHTVLAAVPGYEVEFACSGEEALEQIPKVRPDLVTLDVIMTGMDGLETLEQIMKRHPMPVVMISSLTSDGASTTMTALSRGAIDFVAKPRGVLDPTLEPFRSELLQAVRTAARARVAPSAPTVNAAPLSQPSVSSAPRPGSIAAGYFPVVLLGASTGGPPAIETVLSALTPDFRAPIVIAQHMPAGFTQALAERLNRSMRIPVEEVSGVVPLQPGRVYVGKGDADLEIGSRQGQLIACSLPPDEKRRWHPNVNRLVESGLAATDPGRLIGVLLTGMGDDGAAAMSDLHLKGGKTIAEAEQTAVVWGMPGALVNASGADQVLPLPRIGPALMAMAG